MAAVDLPALEPVDEVIEITDDMIVELAPQERRGKLLHFPPPLPRAQVLPAPSRRRRRGSFPIIKN